MEEMKSNSGTGWNILNTILGGGALATALGVGIPALVKANDAEDANCGGKGKCSENTFVNRYELAQAQEIAQLKADRETDAKLQKLYEQTVAENKGIREKMASNNETIYKELVAQREAQLIANARFEKEIALNKQANFYQDQLYNCRFVNAKKVVAKDDICPEVMERYNSWTAPTNTATETPAG